MRIQQKWAASLHSTWTAVVCYQRSSVCVYYIIINLEILQTSQAARNWYPLRLYSLSNDNRTEAIFLQGVLYSSHSSQAVSDWLRQLHDRSNRWQQKTFRISVSWCVGYLVENCLDSCDKKHAPSVVILVAAFLTQDDLTLGKQSKGSVSVFLFCYHAVDSGIDEWSCLLLNCQHCSLPTLPFNGHLSQPRAT